MIRASLAGIDDRYAVLDGTGERRCNAADFGSDNLGDARDAGAIKDFAECAPHADSQHWIKLVIDKAIYLEDAIPQVPALAANALDQLLHTLLYLCMFSGNIAVDVPARFMPQA